MDGKKFKMERFSWHFSKMKPIVIFYHQYLVNDWKELISEQLTTLYKSGLYDIVDKICLGVVGEKNQLQEYHSFISQLTSSYKNNNKIEIKTTTENIFEYLTLNWLKEYCDKKDCYILYFHTKGISKPMNDLFARLIVKDWRNCMTYFCIENYKKCISKLEEGYDTVGICFRSKQINRWHYSGNFWWANSNYIKRLIPVEKFTKRRHKYRLRYEKWLFYWKDMKDVIENCIKNKIRPNVKVCNLYRTKQGWNKKKRHPREKYVNKI